MKAWQEELVHSLQASLSEKELFKILTSQTHLLGFDHCAYVLQLPLPIANTRSIMMSDYPVAWQTRYLNEKTASIDPILRHGFSSPLPLAWDSSTFTDHKSFWEEACSVGLRYGCSQASTSSCHTRGILTLARASEPIAPIELEQKGLQLAWLAQTGNEYMSKHLINKHIPESNTKLSEREVAVLRWTAEGKTSREISDILELSERTINFHVANAMTKLNCVNKTASVIRAAVLGFL